MMIGFLHYVSITWSFPISQDKDRLFKKMQRVKYKSCEASSKRSFKIYDRPVAFYFQITNDKKKFI